MDKTSFQENVLCLLDVASNAGDATTERGTRLIGHAPDVAPRAYVHVVYAPLAESDFAELRERLERPIPLEYERFLSQANGLSLWVGAFRVLGYVPNSGRTGSGVYDHPSNVILPNVTARLGGLSPEAVVVGWYTVDSSYAVVEKDGTVTRRGVDFQTWPSFDQWLTGEVKAMSAAHRAPSS